MCCVHGLWREQEESFLAGWFHNVGENPKRNEAGRQPTGNTSVRSKEVGGSILKLLMSAVTNMLSSIAGRGPKTPLAQKLC